MLQCCRTEGRGFERLQLVTRARPPVTGPWQWPTRVSHIDHHTSVISEKSAEVTSSQGSSDSYRGRLLLQLSRWYHFDLPSFTPAKTSNDLQELLIMCVMVCNMNAWDRPAKSRLEHKTSSAPICTCLHTTNASWIFGKPSHIFANYLQRVRRAWIMHACRLTRWSANHELMIITWYIYKKGPCRGRLRNFSGLVTVLHEKAFCLHVVMLASCCTG